MTFTPAQYEQFLRAVMQNTGRPTATHSTPTGGPEAVGGYNMSLDMLNTSLDTLNKSSSAWNMSLNVSGLGESDSSMLFGGMDQNFGPLGTVEAQIGASLYNPTPATPPASHSPYGNAHNVAGHGREMLRFGNLPNIIPIAMSGFRMPEAPGNAAGPSTAGGGRAPLEQDIINLGQGKTSMELVMERLEAQEKIAQQ
ncbi:hypothetical protein JAAARDRAFT_200300 [Jaapia argillacea MUCL 33604]|uniref:Uncharacterized protein n=1 Tax=Jaapia argillacea MUCL 33604 TaxID=933084 RepID=A0A067P577_9AGAM|nr:hypothetical protein JAAARDRAFT_200300 [Jaapia argillacea MUCL 33604]